MNPKPTTIRRTKIRSLGYLGLAAPDLDEWRSFATDVFGLQVAEGTTPEQLLLRCDERSWRIAITPGEGALSYVGWEVSGEEDLEEAAEDLATAGVKFAYDADLAQERRVAGLVRTTDPAGNQVEIFYGPLVETERFVSPRGARFRTAEQGLGHIVIGVPDKEAELDFYQRTLGFRVSDSLGTGPNSLTFLHVNPRHHSLAVGRAPGEAGLHHFMLEVDDLDTVGMALDRVLANGIELRATLGKHSNDHVVSFYVKSPSSCEVEYGWDGRPVDDTTWTTAHYARGDLWGHARRREHTPGKH
ncbi:VOC family protein [Streptomyces sp. NPDC090106]|uniref:VOC family protein n=1 Tax=Streptomyces sp. NPDC090106 TaxID=3365946 RepID=UPI00380239D6